jgi:hypothetical protein
VSFSLITGIAPSASNVLSVPRAFRVAAALLGVSQRQQDLGHRDLVRVQQFLVGMCEADLAHRGGGLALLEPQLSRPSKPRCRLPRAIAPDDTKITSWPRLRKSSHIGGKAFEPGSVQPSLRTIHQQRRTHLDHHALGFGQATSSGFAVCDGHGNDNIAIYLSKRPHLILPAD